MSRRAAAALIALAALVLIFGGLWLGRDRRPRPGAPESASATGTVVPELPPEPWRATLWLPTSGGLLAPFETEIVSAPEIEARVRALIAALLATPSSGERVAVFPEPVRAAAEVIDPDGTLYVDLRGESGGPPPGAGSTLETQRIYSIVHTVLRNEPRVARVVLLWNGVQRESLSGHVDTGRPLGLRPELEVP